VAEIGPIHLAAEDAKIDGSVQKPISILTDEGTGEGSQLATRRSIQKSYEPKVMKAESSVGGDEKIARMGITVEDAENENLVQVRINEILCEPRPL
jgi:hypothetical protein